MKDTDWEILYELYKNPNMTKVANLLYITQPSLTKRLQHMESEFQITIVNRTPKGLEFTPEGEFLAKQAGEYLKFLKETKEKLEEFKEKEQGTILIGSAYTYSKYTLTDVLVKYNEKHPHTNFEIINEQSNILFRKMLEGSIDVGFIRGDYEGPVNKVLIGRDKSYLVTKEPVDMDELPKMQWIGYKTNDRTAELLDGWWRNRFGTEPPSGMSVGYIDFAWQLINKGLGYTCCFLPSNFENEYNLCLTPLKNLDGTDVCRNTWFVYSKNKRMSGLLEEFIDYIEREVAIK
ncbi:MAG: LysR family transcriptional regulator [Bariatricus sp.]